MPDADAGCRMQGITNGLIQAWKAFIEFESNDQIKMFQFVCSHLLVQDSDHSNNKACSYFRHKTMWQNEYKEKNFKQFKTSLNVSYD